MSAMGNDDLRGTGLYHLSGRLPTWTPAPRSHRRAVVAAMTWRRARDRGNRVEGPAAAHANAVWPAAPGRGWISE